MRKFTICSRWTYRDRTIGKAARFDNPSTVEGEQEVHAACYRARQQADNRG